MVSEGLLTTKLYASVVKHLHDEFGFRRFGGTIMDGRHEDSDLTVADDDSETNVRESDA